MLSLIYTRARLGDRSISDQIICLSVGNPVRKLPFVEKLPARGWTSIKSIRTIQYTINLYANNYEGRNPRAIRGHYTVSDYQ